MLKKIVIFCDFIDRVLIKFLIEGIFMGLCALLMWPVVKFSSLITHLKKDGNITL